MKFILCLIVCIPVVFLSGCGWEVDQYDTQVGSCELSDNKAEISIYEYVDSDQTKIKKTSQKFDELCKGLKGQK